MNSIKFLLALAVLSMGAASCRKNYFEQTAYEELIEASFPVENIDPRQTWATMASATLRLTTSLMPNESYQMLVYDRDPTSSPSHLSLLWQGTVGGKESKSITVNYLIASGAAYVALVDKLDYMSVFRVPVSNGYGTQTLSIDKATSVKQMTTLPQADTLALRYLFENNFPRTGDFDFNDAVISLTPSIEGKKVTLRVSLDAVGALEPMGAAIRVVGLTADDVVSAEREGNMDKDFPFPMDMQMRIIKTDDYLLPDNMKFGTNEVVLNLFSNAHWAMKHELAIDGSFPSLYFNTKERFSGDEDYEDDVAPAVVTYTFQLATEAAARRFVVENFDVFIVEEYNGGFWEVHTVPYKTVEVLRDYASGQKAVYGNNVPWALCVPGYVKYPLEKQAIATSVNIAVGAYQRFPKWAQNLSQSTNWYDYPFKGLVYEN